MKDCKVDVAPRKHKKSKKVKKSIQVCQNPMCKEDFELENLMKDCKVDVAPRNYYFSGPYFSYKDELEKTNALNWKLSILFQDLFTIENQLNFIEDDSADTEMNKITPEEPNILAMLVNCTFNTSKSK